MKIGCDICSVKRIESAYGRFGRRFLERVLTEQEIDYVLSQPAHTVERIAGRFAAKEAVAKALGTGWSGVGWKDVEIFRHSSGEPGVNLHDRAVSVARDRGIKTLQLSISHEREYAIAMVVAC